MRNSRGEGVISALIAVAILGLIAMTLASLYQIYTQTMFKSYMRNEADNLRKRVEQVLLQRTLCNQAINGTVWTGQGQAPIASIRESGVIIAQQGMMFGSGRMTISALFIRPRDINQNGLPDDLNMGEEVRILNARYTSFPADVVIRFAATADNTGLGVMHDRVIPVMVLVNQLTNVIEFCDINDESSARRGCNRDEAAADYVAGQGLTQCPDPKTDQGCTRVYYVARLNAQGDPVCACKEVCPQPAWKRPRNTGNCSGNANRTCPAGAENLPPYVACALSQVGDNCNYKIFVGAVAPCTNGRPYQIWRMTCE